MREIEDLEATAGTLQPSREALFDAARGIADSLLERAVAGADGSLIWLDPVHLRPEGRQDRGNSYYLYSGSAGIALFLAAMAEALPDRSYGEAAEGALRPILDVFRDPQAKMLLADEGLGVGHGLGGIVYALTLSSIFLDQPEYINSARHVVEHITPERIASDRKLDVEGGSAGAILGLSALYQAYPDASVLDVASACGRHLLKHQQPGPEGGAAWKSRKGDMLAGFAHGASGVALALVRLGRLVNDQTLVVAAERALEFEDSLYDTEKKNWPLTLVDRGTGRQESRNMSAWCHGAPGIAQLDLVIS
jgi:lantibiotic modifying enzyme